MSAEQELQASYLDKVVSPEKSDKKFVRVRATRLSEWMALDNPTSAIIDSIQRDLVGRKEQTDAQIMGSALHEALDLTLFVETHPLPLSKEEEPRGVEIKPEAHAQKIATAELPKWFPTANKTDTKRRKAIVTHQLPSIWPKEGEVLTNEDLDFLYNLAHEHIAVPHLHGQSWFLATESNRLDGVNRLKNIVSLSRENLMPKIAGSEHTFCELTTIQYFRGGNGDLNVQVNGRADLLIINQTKDEIPIVIYDLYEIKSGGIEGPDTQKRQSYINQLYLMMRALERSDPYEIMMKLENEGVLIIESGNKPIGFRINCHLIWRQNSPKFPFVDETITFIDEEKMERKLYQTLRTYRNVMDEIRSGKLRIDLSSG